MIIVVAHQKGGVGKSTIAINLAVELGCPILDLDNQNSVVLFNGIRKKRQNPLEVYTIQSDDEKSAETEILNLLQDYAGFDNKKMLIVDSGGYDSTLNRLAMAYGDYIITPVSPSQIELFGLQKFEKILKDASQKLEQIIKTNILINNADVRSKGDILQLKIFIKANKTHLNLMNSVLHDRKDYKAAYGAGQSVVEYDKHSKAAEEIQDLIREISINTVKLK